MMPTPTWFMMLPTLALRTAPYAHRQEAFAVSLLICMFGNPPSQN